MRFEWLKMVAWNVKDRNVAPKDRLPLRSDRQRVSPVRQKCIRLRIARRRVEALLRSQHHRLRRGDVLRRGAVGIVLHERPRREMHLLPNQLGGAAREVLCERLVDDVVGEGDVSARVGGVNEDDAGDGDAGCDELPGDFERDDAAEGPA